MHPSGKLIPAWRARWFKPVAFVTLRRRDIEVVRDQETPAAGKIVVNVPVAPAPVRPAKISLSRAPSAMEQLADSWPRKS